MTTQEERKGIMPSCVYYNEDAMKSVPLLGEPAIKDYLGNSYTPALDIVSAAQRAVSITVDAHATATATATAQGISDRTALGYWPAGLDWSSYGSTYEIATKGYWSTVEIGGLTLGQWRDLLEPFGYATAGLERTWYRTGTEDLGDRIEIRLALHLSSPKAADQNEWLVRADLLMQAAGAVEAVKGAGYWLTDAPEIEIGGSYKFSIDGETSPVYVLDHGAGSVRMIVRKNK